MSHRRCIVSPGSGETVPQTQEASGARGWGKVVGEHESGVHESGVHESGVLVKVLVATAVGQGLDPDDHCWATEGELVRLVDCSEAGCGYRAFTGLESRQATSTARVAERRDLDPFVLSLVFRHDSERQSLIAGRDEVATNIGIEAERLAEIAAQVEAEVSGLVELLADLVPGTVVERGGSGLRVRHVMA